MPFPVIPVIGLAIGATGLAIALRKPKLPASVVAAATNPNVPTPAPASAKAQAPVPVTPQSSVLSPAAQLGASAAAFANNAILRDTGFVVDSPEDLAAMRAQGAAAAASSPIFNQVAADQSGPPQDES